MSIGNSTTVTRTKIVQQQIDNKWGAAIAQWICLRLPSCRPKLESLAHHLRFFQISIQIVYSSLGFECEKSGNKQKEAGIGPLKTKLTLF